MAGARKPESKIRYPSLNVMGKKTELTYATVPTYLFRGSNNKKELSVVPKLPFMVGLTFEAAAEYGQWVAVYEFLGGSVDFGVSVLLSKRTEEERYWHQVSPAMCDKENYNVSDLHLPGFEDDTDHAVICDTKRIRLLRILPASSRTANTAGQNPARVISGRSSAWASGPVKVKDIAIRNPPGVIGEYAQKRSEANDWFQRFIEEGPVDPDDHHGPYCKESVLAVIGTPTYLFRGSNDKDELAKIPALPFMVALTFEEAVRYGKWVAIYAFIGSTLDFGYTRLLNRKFSDKGHWSEADPKRCKQSRCDLCLADRYDDYGEPQAVICNTKSLHLLGVLPAIRRESSNGDRRA